MSSETDPARGAPTFSNGAGFARSELAPPAARFQRGPLPRLRSPAAQASRSSATMTQGATVPLPQHPVPDVSPASIALEATPAHSAPLDRRMLVIGVLGGIASGKSRFAELLAGDDGVVVDADALVRELYRSPQFAAQLAEHLGPDVLGPDGLPDRGAIAARVFERPQERAWLEREIHPLVRERIRAALDAAAQRRAPLAVLDVPLLLENDGEHHLAERCDALVFVDSPLALREQRAIASRGWKSGEVARREATQLPLAEKRRRARWVIDNASDPNDLASAAQRVRTELGLATPH